MMWEEGIGDDSEIKNVHKIIITAIAKIYEHLFGFNQRVSPVLYVYLYR